LLTTTCHLVIRLDTLPRTKPEHTHYHRTDILASIMSQKPAEYHRLNTSEFYCEDQRLPSPRRRATDEQGTRQCPLSITTITTLASTIIFVLFFLLACGGLSIFLSRSPSNASEFLHPRVLNPHASRKPCGTTPTEARQRGCQFDVTSFCWLPEACWDAELSQDFDSYTQWTWWLDENGTRPISHQLVATGEYTDLFVSWEYHLRHCTAMWRKMHRALLRGGLGAIDSYVGLYNHTLHCEKMLLDTHFDLKEVNSIIRVKYPDCG
jgi:hypothetical protein